MEYEPSGVKDSEDECLLIPNNGILLTGFDLHFSKGHDQPVWVQQLGRRRGGGEPADLPPQGQIGRLHQKRCGGEVISRNQGTPHYSLILHTIPFLDQTILKPSLGYSWVLLRRWSRWCELGQEQDQSGCSAGLLNRNLQAGKVSAGAGG